MEIKEIKRTLKSRAFLQGFASVFTPPAQLAESQRLLKLPKAAPFSPPDPWGKTHELLRNATKTVLGEKPCTTSK